MIFPDLSDPMIAMTLSRLNVHWKCSAEQVRKSLKTLSQNSRCSIGWPTRHDRLTGKFGKALTTNPSPEPVRSLRCEPLRW